MRKMMVIVLAALLAFGGVSALAEAETVYASDFSGGTDGWYPRSTGTAKLSLTEDGALRIEGRDANWHSPGRDFALIPGSRYLMQVQVRQDQADSAGFMISVAHSVDGAESYENLAHGTAAKGEWTELKGEYVAGDYDRFVLYVETTDASTLDFDIRDFVLTAPDGQLEAKPTPEPMVIEAVDELPSLREIYADKFDMGTCVSGRMASTKEIMDFIVSQFNIVTPENELKPDSVLDVARSRQLAKEDETAVAVHFDAARPILECAKANGLEVHGHVLVWHSQTPEAFFREGYEAGAPMVSREVMLGRMENYIRQVMEYMEENYPGVVVSWDVVNEAVDDGDGQLRSSPWLTVVGEDYLARAFEYARRYAPEGTLLYYNDYNTAYDNKLGGIEKLLKALMAEGNIDGYGFQMHHALTSPSIPQISAAVDRIALTGLRLRVSELDITVGNNSEDSFTRQAQMYADIMQILLRHADQFEAVQFWGLTDNMSWRAAQYPLLFDAHRNPKPAFWAVAGSNTQEVTP